MEGLKITKTSATPELCRAILTTALDAGHTHGFGYWAETVDVEYVKDGNEKGQVLRLRLHPHDDEKMIRRGRKTNPNQSGWIYPSEIAWALNRIMTEPKEADAVGWAAQMLTKDYEYPDGPLAEAILQVACFGKVIYG